MKYIHITIMLLLTCIVNAQNNNYNANQVVLTNAQLAKLEKARTFFDQMQY